MEPSERHFAEQKANTWEQYHKMRKSIMKLYVEAGNEGADAHDEADLSATQTVFLKFCKYWETQQDTQPQVKKEWHGDLNYLRNRLSSKHTLVHSSDGTLEGTDNPFTSLLDKVVVYELIRQYCDVESSGLPTGKSSDDYSDTSSDSSEDSFQFSGGEKDNIEEKDKLPKIEEKDNLPKIEPPGVVPPSDKDHTLSHGPKQGTIEAFARIIDDTTDKLKVIGGGGGIEQTFLRQTFEVLVNGMDWKYGPAVAAEDAKKILDKRLGPHWHVVVGTEFNTYCTYTDWEWFHIMTYGHHVLAWKARVEGF